MAQQVLVWMDDQGKVHATEQFAKRADLVADLAAVIQGPKPDEVAEAIVANYQAIRNVIKDRNA